MDGEYYPNHDFTDDVNPIALRPKPASDSSATPFPVYGIALLSVAAFLLLLWLVTWAIGRARNSRALERYVAEMRLSGAEIKRLEAHTNTLKRLLCPILYPLALPRPHSHVKTTHLEHSNRGTHHNNHKSIH